MQRQIEQFAARPNKDHNSCRARRSSLSLNPCSRTRFPHDRIEPVPRASSVATCSIAWSARRARPAARSSGNPKRTKNWIDGWLRKLRDDQRAAKAEIALIVSTGIAEGCRDIRSVDNVWVAEPRFAHPARHCPSGIPDRSRRQLTGTGGPADQDGVGVHVPDRAALPPPHRRYRRKVHRDARPTLIASAKR